jgi:hypothetical protein
VETSLCWWWKLKLSWLLMQFVGVNLLCPMHELLDKIWEMIIMRAIDYNLF